MITLTVDEWEDTFHPVSNTISDNPAWTDGTGNGIMFETYGQEHEFVCSHNLARKVWTYIDGDGGTYITNGYSFVNRIGYFVCDVPYENEKNYQIKVTGDSE